MTRRQEEKLAALALVGSERTDVLYVLEPGVVETTEHACRNLQDNRPVTLEVDVGKAINSGGIGSQIERPGIHHLVEYMDLVGFHRADAVGSIHHCAHRGAGHPLQKNVHARMVSR